MDTLPLQVLSEVLLHLRPMERLRLAPTCRRWVEVTSAPYMLQDVRLSLRGFGLEFAANFLRKSQRRYRFLRIRGELTYYSEDFWKNIGTNLRELSLVDMKRLGPEVLHLVLRLCPKLESFTIKDYCAHFECPELAISPRQVCLDEVRQSLRNVQDLSLEMGMSNKTLERLLWLMPNVTSLAAHSDLDLRILVSNLRSLKQHLTKLELSDFGPDQEAIKELVNWNSSTLQELSLQNCDGLKEGVFSAIGCCTELRLLSLSDAHHFRDHHLDLLQFNAPHLERLDLDYGVRITTEALSRFMRRRLPGRDPSSLSCRDSAELAWREAFRHFGEVPEGGLIELKSVYSDDGILRQISGSRGLRVLQLSKISRWMCQVGGIRRLRVFQALGFRALTVERDARRVFATFETLDTWPPVTEFLYLECGYLTDEGLADIAIRYPDLQTLSLNCCNQISDLGIEFLLYKERNLRELYLSSCSQLSDRTELAVKSLCPQLSVFRFERM